MNRPTSVFVVELPRRKCSLVCGIRTGHSVETLVGHTCFYVCDTRHLGSVVSSALAWCGEEAYIQGLSRRLRELATVWNCFSVELKKSSQGALLLRGLAVVIAIGLERGASG